MKVAVPFFFTFFLFACSNSDFTSSIRSIEVDSEICFDAEEMMTLPINDSIKNQSSSFLQDSDSTPLNITEYPYAGIPRVVIETENYQKIKNRETEIPAHMQIWGLDKPISSTMDLTIRGRGNTSWNTPQKSYKIEFAAKQSILDMPSNRDWALISNFADKTLMKNYLMYHLSASFDAYYAPRCQYVELFLNDEYLGVYLLAETIKIDKNRVNLPEDSNSYIVEFDAKIRDGEQMVRSNVLERGGKVFRIHYPKNATREQLKTIEMQICDFEEYLIGIENAADNKIDRWIDIDEFVKHYWIQEFSKNPDAWFYTSVFFSWVKGGLIRMGPVWDFDLSFGGHSNELPFDEYTDILRLPPEGWYVKHFYWNEYLFKDSVISMATKQFWLNNRTIFENVISSVDSIYALLELAAKNNFKRWDVLGSTEYQFHTKSYSSYKGAVDDLKLWLRERIAWVNMQL